MASRTALLASLAAASLVVAASFVHLSCGSQKAACEAPATTIYDCAPIDPDAGVLGCVAGPNPISTDVPDKDKVYPAGCLATTPYCSPILANAAEQCRCESDILLDGGLAWICPVE